MEREIYHVLPVNDIKSHDENARCKCQPKVEENGCVIVHNAYDGREFDEIAEQIERGH